MAIETDFTVAVSGDIDVEMKSSLMTVEPIREISVEVTETIDTYVSVCE